MLAQDIVHELQLYQTQTHIHTYTHRTTSRRAIKLNQLLEASRSFFFPSQKGVESLIVKGGDDKIIGKRDLNTIPNITRNNWRLLINAAQLISSLVCVYIYLPSLVDWMIHTGSEGGGEAESERA